LQIMPYQERINLLNDQLRKLKRNRNMVGLARLIVLLSAFSGAWLAYPHGLNWTIGVFVVIMAVFLRLVARSADLQQEIHIVENMLSINKEELEIAAHRYTDRRDGAGHLPPNHSYAHDLDIFGRASLFQYIHRTTSEQGDQLLADWLLKPATTEEIRKRQESVKELAPQIAWRQELQARGMLNRVTIATEEKIRAFVSSDHSPFTRKTWRLIRVLIPVIMISLLVLNILGIVHNALFYGMVFIAFLFSGYISKRIMAEYLRLNRITGEMESLTSMFAHIEGLSIQSAYLKKRQHALYHGTVPASGAIRKFRKILDRMDLRLNPLVFIPLNTFLLWDLQQIFALEKWKTVYKIKINEWFATLAAFEAIQSFAALHTNQPGWCFPEIRPEHGVFSAKGLGHPLIPGGKRVPNDFETLNVPQLSLITGSNMAGKSTFLRSIGINNVLALAGAPVCAESLTLSNMRIMSSMRIADNLEESTSTFYAELKKLKTIIDAVKQKEKVFLLLDEILRGTNSLDRHTGSAALIQQLIRENAVTVMATHDLELAKLAEQYPTAIHNYHFDVQVEGTELYFDYRLKNGICTSLNASILMKKIGIDI